MEGEVAKIDTEDFIREVERQPAVWNMSLDEYSDKIAKRNAWTAIITAFFKDFDEKTAAEKKNLGELIQRKWKSLRSSYMRELSRQKENKQSGCGATSRKTYVFFDQLNFLQTASKCTKSSIGDDNEETEEGQDKAIDDEINSPPAKRPKSKKDSNEDDILKKQFLQKTQDDNDQDKFFFLSLVPEIKSLPDDVKLDVKVRLMGVLSQARQEYLKSTGSQNVGHQQPSANYGANLPGPGQYAGGRGSGNGYQERTAFHVYGGGIEPIHNSYGLNSAALSVPAVQVNVLVTLAPLYTNKQSPRLNTPVHNLSPSETGSMSSSSDIDIDFAT